MNYKLVIADVVDVPVNFNVADGGRQVNFAFSLQAPRLSTDAVRTMAEDRPNESVAEFLAAQVTGWRNQRLVLGDDGQPADFSPEAFACMLGLVGVPGIVLAAYLEACGAKGKAKN